MDRTIADSLQSWASQATPDELRVGPHAERLGGRVAVAAVAEELAAGPLFPYLIDLAGNDDIATADTPQHLLDRAVLRGVAEHSRHSSFTSALTRLLAYPSLIHRLGRPLEQALQRRAEAGAEPDADPAAGGIAAIALETWLYLCSSRILKAHRLLAFLTDLPDFVTSVPLSLATRLPRVAGLAHEHFGDDDLLVLLERLTDIPEAEADADFELALADLRRALSAETHEAFALAIAKARQGFAVVEAADEARHDAQTYAAALDAIMAFDNSNQAPFRDAVARLDSAVSQHLAWLSGGYMPAWAWARAKAETAWLQLAATLDAATNPLHDTCWYNPGEAIAALRDAYKAGRSFAVDAEAGALQGIDLLIQPAVEGAFVRDTHLLALLDRALVQDPAFSGDEAVQELHDAVHAAMDAINGPQPPVSAADGGDGLGKELSRLPAVLRHSSDHNIGKLISQLPPPVLETLESVLWNNEIAQAESGNIKVERKLEELAAELATSPDWNGPIAGSFKILLSQTVLYLLSRYNIGASMGGERTAFLRSADPQSVLERALQQDYYEWLTQGPLYNTIQAETINRSRGRADILVRFRNASFCVECKRELKDASRSSLRAYLGQEAVYTDTDASLGILLVLDLTTPASGAPDLFSSVWVEQVRREQEEHARYIVVARLPGSKRAPSVTLTPEPAH
jgi:hypothetical protein